MLDGLFVTPAVTAIEQALASIDARDPDATIAVVGSAKLAQAMRAKRAVVAVGLSPRAARAWSAKSGGTAAIADTTSLEAGALAAIVGVDVASDDNWLATLRAWSRAVRDGGALVLVDRGRACEASKRALCCGLTELEQRHAGRAVITSGLVTHL